MKKKNVKSFSTRWGFILASVGSAVGMANVWGFPNKMGSNGGGAFLLIYILFVLSFSYVGLPAEFAMGRRAATGTLGGETAVIPGLTGGGMVEITEGLTEGQTVYYQEAYDPYAYYYGTGGNASGGDAWIEDASGGDAAIAEDDGAYADSEPLEG